MGFADWLHGLVRLAMLRRQRTGAEPRPTVAKTFEQLLKQHVLAFGQKEDSDQFRREFWAQDVQRKLEPYWYPLKVRQGLPRRADVRCDAGTARGAGPLTRARGGARHCLRPAARRRAAVRVRQVEDR